MNLTELILFGGSMLLVGLAQARIKANYNKYGAIDIASGKSGATVAKKMLSENGLGKVAVNEVQGELTDHYNPKNKTVSLSTAVHNESSIASAAVAAHEVGHAIQDSVGYKFMRIRAALVPVVNLASYLGYIVIALGAGMQLLNLITIGIIAQLVVFSFHVVTLPVEFNATARAKKYLKDSGIVTAEEFKGAKAMLNAAAFTYVASMITNLAYILRLVLSSTSRRR